MIPKKESRIYLQWLNSLGSDHVQINTITVAHETQKKQEFGMADIKELDQDEEDNNLIVNSITVNKIPIGKACSPYKVLQV